MAKFNALDTHGYVLAILEAADETDADLYRLRNLQPQCARVVAVRDESTTTHNAALTEAKGRLADALDQLQGAIGRPKFTRQADTAADQPGLRGSLARLSMASGETFTEAGLDAAVQGHQGRAMQPRTIVVPRQEARLLAGSRASSGATLSERGRQRGAGLGRLIELREGGKVIGWQVPAGHRS